MDNVDAMEVYKSEQNTIKNKYGEKMWHYCRETFPTILEAGKLSEILLKNFHPIKTLYDDLEKEDSLGPFRTIILSNFDKQEGKIKQNIAKTPEELLKEAGYKLYECKTEKDIQNLKKYYKEGEELCTFRGGRLNSCYVYFAVKENVDEIKRGDFLAPKRQDEYGTSVISIQFTRDDSHTLSIKNRYNHTVVNPDATFSNNLDNIILGLTESIEKHYGMIQKYKTEFDLPGYVKAKDGKYYKYNYEINNVYYCPDNIIIDNFEPKQYDKNQYLVFNQYILDIPSKKIYIYDESIKDDFPKIEEGIKKILIKKEKGFKRIELLHDNGFTTSIVLDKNNDMIEYKNNYIEEVYEIFPYNHITSFELKSLKTISGNTYFPNLQDSRGLESLTTIGEDAYFPILQDSRGLRALTKIGGNAYFDDLQDARGLESLTKIGENAHFNGLKDSRGLESLTTIGWSAYFESLQDARGLSSLESIGGEAHFESLPAATGLSTLTTIGWNAYFNDLKDSRGLESLIKIVGEAYFPIMQDASWLNEMISNGRRSHNR